MAVIEPNAEFRSLSEISVLNALNDEIPDNPVAAKVARLISCYMVNFRQHVERLGYMPSDTLRITPRWPIEAVAMRLPQKRYRTHYDSDIGCASINCRCNR